MVRLRTYHVEQISFVLRRPMLAFNLEDCIARSVIFLFLKVESPREAKHVLNNIRYDELEILVRKIEEGRNNKIVTVCWFVLDAISKHFAFSLVSLSPKFTLFLVICYIPG